VVLTESPPTVYSSTTIPILLAVPATILIAVSILPAFKSGILISAISFTLALEILETFFLFGSPEPDSIPTAFFNSTETGGVFVINVKDLSW